jgi:galactosylxylosylprotein 3-beta-galactosyltransferase
VFLKHLVDSGRGEGPEALHYVMHADDDSFVRLDLLMPYLESCPKERFYWGYIWDGQGNRKTAPIRNPVNKSRMPVSQYPLDYYPPFASGCGFILSWDLVLALTKQPLPDYRLLDPPFGIHLCGPPSDGYLVLSEPIVPVHDDRVRPYRAIPIFHPNTIVQHYLKPEEMKPFYVQACAAAAAITNAPTSRNSNGPELSSRNAAERSGAPEQLYEKLVDLGLLRR